MAFVNSNRDLIKFALNYTRGKNNLGMTRAILDARSQNQLITEQDTKFDDGKKRKMFINYYPPVCADTGTGTENICDPGTVQEPRQAYFEVSQITASAVYQLNPNDLRYVDNNWTYSQHAVAQILAVLPTVREKMDAQLAALLIANAGVLPDGNASRLLPVIDKSTGIMNPTGMWTIEEAYLDTGYSNPYIVGGTDVFQWQKAVGIGGMNNSGQNVAQMGANNLYYSKIVNTTFASPATEHVISFDPSMLKFVSFNRNAGIFATDDMSIEDIDAVYARSNENMIRGVLPDPVTGLIWDLNVHYDPCLNNGNGGFKFQIKLEWDLFFMPAPVCNIQGVNGIFHWLTCIPLVATCETGSPIVPETSATFAADTNGELTFPIANLHSLNIAGQQTYPDVEVANIAALRTLMNANAPAGYTFTVSGTELRYTGYAGIDVVIDGTTLTFTD